MPSTPVCCRQIVRVIAVAFSLNLAWAPAAARAACPSLGPHEFLVKIENGGAPLTDYFALVTLDTAGPIALGLMRTDLQDMRVGDAACNPLDFWIESGVNTTATRVWVKVPTVPTGASQFGVYFGDPAATRINQASDIFGAGVASVYTFTENSGTSVADWVGGHNLTVSPGLTWQPGPRAGVGTIGGFDAARLLAADSGAPLGNGDFTAFSMVRPEVDTPNTEVIIGAYPSDGANGWHIKREGVQSYNLVTNQGGSSCVVGGVTAPASAWSFVGGRRRTGLTNSVFHNGVLILDGCGGDARNVTNPAATFELGRGYEGNYAFSGSVSLSLVYTRALTDPEIAALHASLFPSVEPTVTVEETIAVTSPAASTFTVTTPGTFTFTADGITPDIDISGTLPAGVAYDDATATISGAPVLGTVGSYPLTVTATSGLGTQTMQAFTLEVVKAGQTIVFANPGPQVIGGPPVALSASASSGLPVVFTSSSPDVCSVGGSSATMVGAGTCTIHASQPGDGNYQPAPQVSQSFRVTSGPPDPPDPVRVTVLGHRVTLTWEPAVTGPPADAFLVEVGDAPGRTTVTTLMTTRRSEVGFLPRGEYFLRVRAVNAAGVGLPSSDVWANVTASLPVALPPVGIGASVSGSTVHLSWQAAPQGAAPESYLLQIGTDILSPIFAEFTVPASTTTLTVPNVPDGTYAVRIRAQTTAAITPPSPAIWLRVGTPTACGTAPEAPRMLTPVISDGIVGLSWLPPPSGSAKSFVVQAGSGPGLSDLFAADIGAVAGVGATAGDGRYLVRALSTSDCGVSDPSAEQTLTIAGPTPAAPTGLTAVPGPGGVTFTWTPPPSGPAATHYLLEAGLSAGTTLIKFPVTAASTITIPGVPSGLTFVARVRSANASGIGVASAEMVVTVP